MMLVERGVASASDVDVAMKLGAGHPMGPIQLADYIGLDTVHSIIAGWAEEFPDNPSFKVPASLAAKVAEGKLGRKSGEGFFQSRATSSPSKAESGEGPSAAPEPDTAFTFRLGSWRPATNSSRTSI